MLCMSSLMVDETPIRVFNNNEAIGVPFPNTQAMNVYSSIWCGDSWATQGGSVKTDWAYAPFTASYENLVVNSCQDSSGSSSSCSGSSSNTTPWLTQQLDVGLQAQLSSVQNKYMIYNYCTDYKRFPQGCPTECNQPRFLQWACVDRATFDSWFLPKIVCVLDYIFFCRSL